jgi:N-methylhydantoinase A/oxoprolinase/acetone carboxylase beta subunit
VLSALGLAAAPERVDVLASLHRPLAELEGAELAGAFEPLIAAAAGALPDAQVSRFVDCRFRGQGYEVTVPALRDDPPALSAAFRAAHRARHGHADSDSSVELVNLRVVAERSVALPTFGQGRRGGGGGEGAAKGRREIVTRDGKRVRAEVWPLGELPAGRQINGPAVLAGPDATGLIEPGWRGVVHASGAVIVERA